MAWVTKDGHRPESTDANERRECDFEARESKRGTCFRHPPLRRVFTRRSSLLPSPISKGLRVVNEKLQYIDDHFKYAPYIVAIKSDAELENKKAGERNPSGFNLP
jgi:hypothetical protein